MTKQKLEWMRLESATAIKDVGGPFHRLLIQHTIEGVAVDFKVGMSVEDVIGALRDAAARLERRCAVEPPPSPPFLTTPLTIHPGDTSKTITIESPQADALRAIIERAEHRMSSKVIDDVVAIARAGLVAEPTGYRATYATEITAGDVLHAVANRQAEPAGELLQLARRLKALDYGEDDPDMYRDIGRLADLVLGALNRT
jgi:hypothetical protein